MRRIVVSLVMLAAIAASPAAGQDFVRDSLYAGLRGEWLGTLTYRDYGNNKLVTLPTRVFAERTGDAALALGFIYDDGPGKTVRSRELLTVDPATRSWQTRTEGDSAVSRSMIVETSGFVSGTSGRVVRFGSITENDAPAESRDTLTLAADKVVLLHETRTPGGTFAMRNELRLRRVVSPR